MKSPLLILALFSSLANAALLGTFCSQDLGFASIPTNGRGIPRATFTASTICFTFVGNLSFQIFISGQVRIDPYAYNSSAVCTGLSTFGAGNTIILAAETCQQDNNTLPGFCPWACLQFGGTYQAFFTQPYSDPRYLFINPASVSPIYNWGNMDVAFPMRCMNATCGSATDIFPPAPLPQNSVREILF